MAGLNDRHPRLPPGCSPSDIPGNRPEDIEWQNRLADLPEGDCAVCGAEAVDEDRGVPVCGDHDADGFVERLREERATGGKDYDDHKIERIEEEMQGGSDG